MFDLLNSILTLTAPDPSALTSEEPLPSASPPPPPIATASASASASASSSTASTSTSASASSVAPRKALSVQIGAATDSLIAITHDLHSAEAEDDGGSGAARPSTAGAAAEDGGAAAQAQEEVAGEWVPRTPPAHTALRRMHRSLDPLLFVLLELLKKTNTGRSPSLFVICCIVLC
jgi:hypothetical protein